MTQYQRVQTDGQASCHSSRAVIPAWNSIHFTTHIIHALTSRASWHVNSLKRQEAHLSQRPST